MNSWRKARKKPIVVEYRRPQGLFERVQTLDGELIAKPGTHYVIKGVEGELYPINIDIFEKTYDRLD